MGTATNSTSVLVEQGETVPVYSGEHCSIPSGRLLLYNFYPFPIFVGHWEDRRSGNLGVLQMRFHTGTGQTCVLFSPLLRDYEE